MKKEPGMIITHQRLISKTKNEITTEYTYREPGRKKEKKMLVTYTYGEPKSKEEAVLAEANLHKAYGILFDETLRRLKEKDPDGI
jgi:hypothetical protein